MARAAYFGLALFVALAGCGPTPPPVQTLHPVRGKVLLPDGSPARGAVVIFEPAGRGTTATGELDATGNFTMFSTGAREGVMAGDYKVLVTPNAVVQKMKPADLEVGKRSIPKKYWSDEKTDLTASVEERSNEFTFKLKN
jgi:hypothetical protein